MTLKLRLPHYFSFKMQREVKELYAAAAIADVALAAMLVFEPIYLHEKVGLPIVDILLFFAAVYAWYIVLIPVGAKVATALGRKHALVLSVPFQLAYWACLLFAIQVPWLLWLAPLFYALEKSFYWPAFHAIVARFANQGQVGREFSLLTVIIQIAQTLGPLLGGIIAQRSGSSTLLIVAGVIFLLSIVPLLLHKEQGYEPPYHFKRTLHLYKSQYEKMVGYWGFGEELLALTVWPVFIYLVVKGYEETGIIITIAAAFSGALSLYVGKMTDGHPKRPLIKLGAVLASVSWLIRPFMPGSNGAFASDSMARVSKNVYFIPLSTVTYERAEASSILPYVVFFEQSLAIGKMLTALIGAGIFALTGSFALLFLFAAAVSLLYWHL